MKLTLKQTVDLLKQFQAVTHLGFVYVTESKRGTLEIEDTWMHERLRVSSAELEDDTVILDCTKGMVRFGGIVPDVQRKRITVELLQLACGPSLEQLKAALAGKSAYSVTCGRAAVVMIWKKDKMVAEIVVDLAQEAEHDSATVEDAVAKWRRAHKMRGCTHSWKTVDKF